MSSSQTTPSAPAPEFPKLINDTLIKAARGEKTDYVPVWVMRQAGRYLPEFRELRQHHPFFDIIKSPQLASEVTMQPIRRFNLDAAIIFSDILVIPQILGLEVLMKPKEGPVFPEPLQDPKDMKTRLNFEPNVAEDLKHVYEAITLTRHSLAGKVPLIGFSGAPWTLMCYMIEGGGSKTMSNAKKWLYKYPYESIELIELLTKTIIKHLVEQVRAGAQLLQVFDTNAGYLTPSLFKQFSLPFLEKIATEVKNQLKEQNLESVPLTIFAKDAHYALEELATIGYDVVSIDWTISPKQARSAFKDKVTIQGNLDPCALYGEPDDIDYMVSEMISEFGTNKYIANLGHGIYPDVDPKNMNCFVNAVHKHSKIYNKKN